VDALMGSPAPKTSDGNARVYAAAAFSPLSIPPVLAIGVLALNSPHPSILDAVVWTLANSGFFLFFVYLVMGLVGLPLYFLLRRMKLDTVWTALAVGYLAAISFLAVLRMDSGVSFRDLDFWADPLVLFGPIVGFTFWWIAKPRPSRLLTDESGDAV
jgi:hypothetical protein